MNFLGYIANGGLERLLIIGVATLIGYWGYRIYGRSQTPGLALIALAAVVLFSVILTSEQHLQSMNANLMAVASLESQDVQPLAADIPPAEVVAPATDTTSVPATSTQAMESAFRAEDREVEEPAAAASADADADTEATTLAGAAVPARVERLVPLASGQELGGRITSVRSDKLTLEWSSEADNRRIIRPAEPE